MLATHLTQFLKNIFELLDRRRANLEKNDENIMSYFVGFVMNVFKTSTVDRMQLSEEFKASISKDLLAVCGDILNLISYLSPEVELADSPPELEIYNLKNKPFISKPFTSDLFSNHSAQLDDYYWNSEDFVSFNVVQESDTQQAYFEKPILKNKDLQEIQHIVNNTKYTKTQVTRNHLAGSKSKIPTVDTLKTKSEVTTEKSLPEIPIKAEKSLRNGSIEPLSASSVSKENVTSVVFKINENQLSYCTLNHMSVRKIKTLDTIDAKDLSHSTQHISILHVRNWTVINTSFAFDKMEFNSIVREGTRYRCLLCSVYTDITFESLNDHLQSPLHMDKLAKDIIWVSALNSCVSVVGIYLYKCCVCSNSGAIGGMIEHFKSKAHTQSFEAATTTCSSVLEAMENATEHKEINTQMLASSFEAILHQHKIKVVDNHFLCDTCGGIKIPMSLYNLYTHIAGQRHWRPYSLLVKQHFINMSKIRVGTDQTYKGYINVYDSKEKGYCQICKIFIDGASTQVMYSHIKSYAHRKFFMMFLKNEKINPFVDLNEGFQEKSEKLSPTGASQDKLGPDKMKSNTSQKTKIDEPTFLHDAGSYVIFNYNIAIDKYSWNAMMMYENRYVCAPCSVTVPVSDRSMHIAKGTHKAKLASSLVNWKHLTRKIENKISLFCLVCGDWIQEKEITIHSLTIDHKARKEQLTLECERWKADMNRNFAKIVFPTFSEANCDIIVDILKQNQLIVLNRSYTFNVFCKLCLQLLLVYNVEVIYNHVTCTRHFSAFVESMNMNWAMMEPKYVNGVMTSREKINISYCFVCNFTFPSESAAAHRTSVSHTYFMPLFIKNVFPDHGLKNTSHTVMCNMCGKKLSDKSLNIINICDHIKSSIHAPKYVQVLKNVLGNTDSEISLVLFKSDVQRFQQLNISYCGACNILFKGVSDASVFDHTHSKIHYIFEYVYPKKLKKNK